MASIERRDGRNKPYRVHYRDRFTGKLRNKSFTKRKLANAFIETLGSEDNIIAGSDTRVTVEEALERWYKLCTTIVVIFLKYPLNPDHNMLQRYKLRRKNNHSTK